MEASVMINIRKEFDGAFVLVVSANGPESTVCRSWVALKSLPHTEDFLGVFLALEGGVIYQSDLPVANPSLTTATSSFLAAAQN